MMTPEALKDILKHRPLSEFDRGVYESCLATIEEEHQANKILRRIATSKIDDLIAGVEVQKKGAEQMAMEAASIVRQVQDGPAFLRSLSEALMLIAPVHGTNQCDAEKLISIAREMEGKDIRSPKLCIVVDGGLIQGVAHPKGTVPPEILVIDHDIEGVEEDEIFRLTLKGKPFECHARTEAVYPEETEGDIDGLLTEFYAQVDK